MMRSVLTTLAVLMGLAVVALLVSVSIWPVIDEVETGSTPEYPDLQPRYYSAEPARVFDEVERSVESLDRWTVVASGAASRRIEAERTSEWLGLVDDVTLRVEPVTEKVTRVNARSASRLGDADFGRNARNIETFFGALDDRLADARFDPTQLSEQGERSDDSDGDADDAGDDAP